MSATTPQPPAWPRSRMYVFAALAVTGLWADLYSKHVVFADLGGPGQPGPWVFPFFGGWGTFRFFTSMNLGALWGIGQGMSWLFAALSIAAATGISLWLFRFGAARSLWLTIALALVMSGTLGNLYDRCAMHGLRDAHGSLIHGVRDFLCFTFGSYHYPIFNLADCFLVTGAIMLAIQSFRAEAEASAARTTEPGLARDESVAGTA